MFKTFIASALAAAALAADDGNNYDNMVEYVLIPGKLGLNMYNALNDKTNELHGELVWLDATASHNDREMGFCMKPKDENLGTTWDCMQTRFSVDPAKIDENPAFAKQFNVYDSFSATNLEGLTKDPSWESQSDAGINWRASSARSSMTGCKADETDAKLTTCEKAVSHWFRNFTTSQPANDAQFGLAYAKLTKADETETDEELAARQKTADDAAMAALESAKDVPYVAVGWMSTSDDTYKTEKNRVETNPAIEISPVFAAYVAAVKAGDAEPSPSPTPDNDPETDDEDGNENDGGSEDDGATAVTTFAASVMAAICALAF